MLFFPSLLLLWRAKDKRYIKKELTEAQKWRQRSEKLKAGVVTSVRLCSKFCIGMHMAYTRVRACLSAADERLVQRLGSGWVKPRNAVQTIAKIIWPITAYLCVGAMIGPFEGWTAAESIYFSSVTVLTIGYGDLSPSTAGGRLFCIFYIPMALGVLMATFEKVRDLRIKMKTRKVSLATLISMDEDFDGKVILVRALLPPSRPRHERRLLLSVTLVC